MYFLKITIRMRSMLRPLGMQGVDLVRPLAREQIDSVPDQYSSVTILSSYTFQRNIGAWAVPVALFG